MLSVEKRRFRGEKAEGWGINSGEVVRPRVKFLTLNQGAKQVGSSGCFCAKTSSVLPDWQGTPINI